MTIQNSTYLEMINAGKFGLFRNESLKIVLEKLYLNYEAGGKHIQEFNEYNVKIRVEQMKEITNLKYHLLFSYIVDDSSMFDPSEWKWINDPQSYKFRITEEAILTYSAKHKAFLDYLTQFLEEVNLILTMINDELSLS